MRAISYPFTVRGSIRTTTNPDQIVRGQVIDAVATNQGERLMNPEWGCNLRAQVFDPSDTLVRSDLAGQIARKLPNFVPRATITRADLAVDPAEPNLVRVNIGYKASNYSPEASLSVPLDTSNTDASSGSEVTA